MRKHQQQRILELLQTLEDAHGELCSMATPEIALGFLADCQEFALEKGNSIVEIAGLGTQTVAFLEEYYCSVANYDNLNKIAIDYNMSYGGILKKHYIIRLF